MKVKSIIETKNCEYATLVDIDTMYNHFNDPYFIVNVAISYYEKEVHYNYQQIMNDININEECKKEGHDPVYSIEATPILFNTSQIITIKSIGFDIEETTADKN